MALFNANQLATYAEARALRDWLNTQPQFTGRRILNGDDEKGVVMVPNALFWLPDAPQVPGIYVPHWEGGPAAFPAPNGVNEAGEKLYFLHYRMANGFAGANVGLILDKFRRQKTSPQNVLDEIVKEYV